MTELFGSSHCRDVVRASIHLLRLAAQFPAVSLEAKSARRLSYFFGESSRLCTTATSSL